MWSDDTEVRIGHVGDLSRCEQAAEVQRFRLQDVDDLVLEQLCELLLR